MSIKYAVTFVIAGVALGFAMGFAFLPRVYATQTIVDEYHRRLNDVEGSLTLIGEEAVRISQGPSGTKALNNDKSLEVSFEQVVVELFPFAEAGEPRAAATVGAYLLGTTDSNTDNHQKGLYMLQSAASMGSAEAAAILSGYYLACSIRESDQTQSDYFEYGFYWAKEAERKEAGFSGLLEPFLPRITSSTLDELSLKWITNSPTKMESLPLCSPVGN